MIDRDKIFRRQMLEEATELLGLIKKEKNENRKYQLCENLLEIFEELDIDVASDTSLWNEIKMKYQDFI